DLYREICHFVHWTVLEHIHADQSDKISRDQKEIQKEIGNSDTSFLPFTSLGPSNDSIISRI
ncbi:hypothetical protein PSY19_23875, partial [Shigella flexneri]|nr:hypothetical protein [Shigella flexneri]